MVRHNHRQFVPLHASLIKYRTYHRHRSPQKALRRRRHPPYVPRPDRLVPSHLHIPRRELLPTFAITATRPLARLRGVSIESVVCSPAYRPRRRARSSSAPPTGIFTRASSRRRLSFIGRRISILSCCRSCPMGRLLGCGRIPCPGLGLGLAAGSSSSSSRTCAAC
jgi:hypothetical protein